MFKKGDDSLSCIEMRMFARGSTRRMVSRPGAALPSRARRRRGTAVVEMAVTLPLVVYVTLAGMQASHMISLRHTGLFIVDEVARLGLDATMNDAALNRKGAELATSAGLKRVTFRICRNTATALIQVDAQIPVNDNYDGPSAFPSKTLNVTRSVYREGP